MVLRLKELELLLDPITGLRDREFKLLSRLGRALEHTAKHEDQTR